MGIAQVGEGRNSMEAEKQEREWGGGMDWGGPCFLQCRLWGCHLSMGWREARG